ncbi:MAG: hypothetical protein Q9165_003646 [Trypethelium subeluteriae]
MLSFVCLSLRACMRVIANWHSGYTYSTTLTTGGGASTVVFAGCLSNFPAHSTTTVLNRGDDDILNTTVVSGPITKWAVPLTVEVAATDTHLFTTSSRSKTPTPAAGAGSTSTTATPTIEPSTSTPSPSPSNDHVGIGVGVGVGVGVALIAALLGFFLYRRRRTQRQIGGARPDMPPELDDKQQIPRELDSQVVPPRELQGDAINPELPGSQPARGRSVRQSGPPAELEA